ncbi:MAG: (d)CMP kinase [Oscillospiraceae bacterium]|nr:(d)CMP kinase [Oscillospiraceae bacterium]
MVFVMIKKDKNISIAIDGPVGSGKSTISQKCAARLGFIYVDTGALYRALGVYCKGFEGNSTRLEERIRSSNISLKFADGVQRVFAGGVDYTDKIRTPEASMLASAISARAEVRAFLLELQRSFARENSVVMDGRDIGTVVLPNADIKIFLTAAPRERAKRRYDELIAKGADVEFEKVLADLVKRDYDDSHREHAPLRQADDAIVADTTGNTFEESVEAVMRIINERYAH